MNRYEVSYLGKPFMLYGDSAEYIGNKYKDMIDEGCEIKLLDYPKSLFDILTQPELVSSNETDKQIHELRKVKTDVGDIVYKLGKDKSDDRYFDLVTYRRTSGKLVMPCLKSICSANEFIDRYFRDVPIKKTGYVVTHREIKKLANKSIGKVDGYTIWRDSDGYVYFGLSSDWGKKAKEFYKQFLPFKDTAICVKYCSGIYNESHTKWFKTKDDFDIFWKQECANTPSFAATPRYEILPYKVCTTPIEDRKLIYRLSYLNIERELSEGERIETIARNWYWQNRTMSHNDETDFLKKIIELIIK